MLSRLATRRISQTCSRETPSTWRWTTRKIQTWIFVEGVICQVTSTAKNHSHNNYTQIYFYRTGECTEYGDNNCPRCMSWDHWEDTCWTLESPQHLCQTCNFEGHAPEVHMADKFTQKRACVDILGWEPFREWFYNNEFRSWWQVSSENLIQIIVTVWHFEGDGLCWCAPVQDLSSQDSVEDREAGGEQRGQGGDQEWQCWWYDSSGA